MAIILNIDTAVESASISLAKDAESMQLEHNNIQRDHASWLHVTIDRMMKQQGISLKKLEAIAVTIGPGSYTGLRVGLSAAKGLCMGLNIPLITVGTLEMMAFAVKDKVEDLSCPMIDARRMEVFMAVFDKKDQELIKPTAMIIDENSFGTLLASHHILFSGNGFNKIKPVITHKNASYCGKIATAGDMCEISETLFNKKIVANLAYTEPFYLKEFFTAPQN